MTADVEPKPVRAMARDGETLQIWRTTRYFGLVGKDSFKVKAGPDGAYFTIIERSGDAAGSLLTLNQARKVRDYLDEALKQWGDGATADGGETR